MQPITTHAIPILTIAGSDCSGGAGLQADLKTFSAHGLFGMSVVLSVVAENTARVISSVDMPRKYIDEQFEAIFEDIPPSAVKIGMLGSKEIIECVKENLQKYAPKNCVIDPVMFAKNGFALMPKEICEFYRQTMLSFASVLTPNIPEAQHLCGFNIQNIADMKRAAFVLHKMGAKSVLLKGGHFAEGYARESGTHQSGNNAEIDAITTHMLTLDLESMGRDSKNIESSEAQIHTTHASSTHENITDKSPRSDDVFFNGSEFFILPCERIETKNTHGTGCTLSSAIASNLALGKSTLDSIKQAKEYVFSAILHSLALGKGNGPTNHFHPRLKPPYIV